MRKQAPVRASIPTSLPTATVLAALDLLGLPGERVTRVRGRDAEIALATYAIAVRTPPAAEVRAARRAAARSRLRVHRHRR